MNLIFSDRALSRIPEQAKVTGFSGFTFYKVIKGFCLNKAIPIFLQRYINIFATSVTFMEFHTTFGTLQTQHPQLFSYLANPLQPRSLVHHRLFSYNEQTCYYILLSNEKLPKYFQAKRKKLTNCCYFCKFYRINGITYNIWYFQTTKTTHQLELFR